MKKIGLVVLVIMMGATMVFASGRTSGTVGGASGGGASSGTVRWAYWGGDTRVRISQQAIDLYQAANPGVLVNP
jgi:multiple sugar transport system substrate-binding protein